MTLKDREDPPTPSPPLVLLGTRNAGKLLELEPVLPRLFPDLRFIPLSVVEKERGQPFPEVEESGRDYRENALLKARAYAKLWGGPVLCEDSGLEVYALGGAPGVHSHRYAGERASDGDNIRKLLAELKGVPEEQRGARYVAVAILYFREGLWFEGRGECAGRIALHPRGKNGFGYDPVFLLERGVTMAELPRAEKILISHRTRALESLAEAWARRHPHLFPAQPGA